MISKNDESHKRSEKLIYELPKGLIKWYGFKKGGRALCITADTRLDRVLTEALAESGLETERKIVRTNGIREAESEGKSGNKKGEAGDIPSEKYDIILIADIISRVTETEAESLLRLARKGLKKDGRLFVCADNRFGIRYFCGDKDLFTDRNFDGVENYRRISDRDKKKQAGRLYSGAELARMLTEAGFEKHRFYSVFPDIACPQILRAEDYVPGEELKIRIFPHYHNPDTVFLEEENLYTPLIQNGMFHRMANGFLIECPVDGQFADANQITVSMDRGRENALCTVITRSKRVVKLPAYEEGRGKIGRLLENNRYLLQHGVRMIEAEAVGDSFVMPYVEGVPLAKYFRSLAVTNRQEFFRQFDRLWQVILSSSDPVPYENVDWEHFNPWWDEGEDEKAKSRIDRGKWRRVAFGTEKGREALGPVLRRGYPDLVLLNGFAVGDDFVFYDQEMYVENLPAKAIMLRNIDFLYHGDAQMQKLLPRTELLERYGMEECLEIYYAHIGHFLTKLRNDESLRDYHEAHRRNDEVVHSNRQQMNYSAGEYQRLFVDIFKNMDNKRIYLFGSGNFTKKFLALYKEEYEIAGILDNDQSKWGSVMEEIPVTSPKTLEELDASTYKVIICIKNYTGVLKQVKGLGATNIGIYDTNMEYSRRQREVIVPGDQERAERGKEDTGKRSEKRTEKKKYHVGYVAGVFDLFHIGHLNLLRRAKDQCDYMIAGVVTDEGVRKFKNTESVIPFEERLKIVEACRYVDQAVGIPLEFYDTKDAYLKFQFDVQFSGSDYSEDPVWQKKREFLREHGAELVFFPYTESTSSTRIKEMIAKRLM